jgi:hypothetical protein
LVSDLSTGQTELEERVADKLDKELKGLWETHNKETYSSQYVTAIDIENEEALSTKYYHLK